MKLEPSNPPPPAGGNCLLVKVTFEIPVWTQDIDYDVECDKQAQDEERQPPIQSYREALDALKTLLGKDGDYEALMGYLWEKDYFSHLPCAVSATYKTDYRHGGASR